MNWSDIFDAVPVVPYSNGKGGSLAPARLTPAGAGALVGAFGGTQGTQSADAYGNAQARITGLMPTPTYVAPQPAFTGTQAAASSARSSSTPWLLVAGVAVAFLVLRRR